MVCSRRRRHRGRRQADHRDRARARRHAVLRLRQRGHEPQSRGAQGRAACRSAHSLRDEGQPDAGRGAAHGRAGRWHRRGVGRRADSGARRRRRPARSSASPAPARRDAELAPAVAAGVLVNVESERELRRARAIAARELGLPAARRGARQPRLRAQGFGHEDGRRARSSSASMSSACRELLREIGTPAAASSSASTSSPARRTCAPSRSARRRPKLRARAAAELAKRRRRRCASSTSAAASASPTFPASSALEPAAHRANLATSCSSARAVELPQASLVIELGRYLVGEAGVYVMPRRRPQGLARPRVPGHRRRAATITCRPPATSARCCARTIR